MTSSLRMSTAELLPRVDSAHLDCVSDDLALLLAHAGVADVRSPFAADWRLDIAPDAEGLPRVDLPPTDQAGILARHTGFTPRWHDLADDLDAAVPRWRAELDAGRPVLVVGDAYHLPWLPYHHNEHMPHGFVVEGVDDELVADVVDPYDNNTRYGRASPVATRARVTDLVLSAWAVLDRVGRPEPPDPARQVRRNAAAIAAADSARFPAAHAALDVPALENLALQTWLLARNRSLHGLWLAEHVPGELPGLFDAEVVAGWRRVTEATYLALRRVHGGRAAPRSALTALDDVLARERAVAQRILDGGVM